MNRFNRVQQNTSSSSGAESSTVVKNSSAGSNRRLNELIVKLPLVEQVKLYRTKKEVRVTCDKVWNKTHKRLDFRVLEPRLNGEQMAFFVDHMKDNYFSVHFTADSLQRNLNILDRAGIKALPHVHYCNLRMSSESQSKAKPRTQRTGTNTEEASALGRVRAVLTGDMMPQWPLHALPKLLGNLRRLRVHCDVQVHFIEQFPQLEMLVFHGKVSQRALTGIFERCQNLKRLFIKSPEPPADLQGICNCSNLKELLLPMSIFPGACDKVLSLSALRLLELSTSVGQNVEELTIECLDQVLECRANDIEVLQVNCLNFKASSWMSVGLGRCRKLQGLVLNNCLFEDRFICKRRMPRVNKYLVLNCCPDVTDSQVVSLVRRCPNISELFLFNCPKLTGKVLFKIYTVRRDEKLAYPLNIILDHCDAVQVNYEATYAAYWRFRQKVVKVEYSNEENNAFEGLQIIFHKDLNVSRKSKASRKRTSVAKISMKHEEAMEKISREVNASKITLCSERKSARSKISLSSDKNQGGVAKAVSSSKVSLSVSKSLERFVKEVSSSKRSLSSDRESGKVAKAVSSSNVSGKPSSEPNE